jgi:hypothetical protein
MKWFDGYVGAVQSAFEKTPEILHPVHLHAATYIGFGFVHDFMHLAPLQFVVATASSV